MQETTGNTQKEQGADFQPSLSDYGEKENSWEVCVSLLQFEKAVNVAGGRAKLIAANTTQCSGGAFFLFSFFFQVFFF